MQSSEAQYIYTRITKPNVCVSAGDHGQGLWEGGSVGTSVRGPERQQGIRESLKSLIDLAT